MTARSRVPADTRSGFALVILMFLSLLLVGFATAFLSRGVRETRAGAGHRAIARARYAAESLLSRAEVMLRDSRVDAEGRSERLAEILAGGTRRIRYDGSVARNELTESDYRKLLETAEGTVWVSRLAGDYVRLEAEAEVGMERVHLSRTLRERVPVSAVQRFVGGVGVYPGRSAMARGVSPFRAGDVLEVDPPPRRLTEEEARTRLRRLPPPEDPPEEETRTREQSPGELRMPDRGILSRLRRRTSLSHRFDLAADYVVEFRGSTVRVKRLRRFWWLPPAVTTLPLPENELIFIRGNVISLRGDVEGQVTLAATGDVHVTGSLRYVDAAGRPRMLGGDRPGEEYVPNPEYDGESLLGVIAQGDIFYSPAMPSASEVDAALLSLTGTVGLEMIWYDAERGMNKSGFGVPLYHHSYTARGKSSLKELGSKVSSGMPVTSVAGTDLGFARTVSLYDPQLLTRAPPGFPRFPALEVASTRKVGAVASEGVAPVEVEERGEERRRGAFPHGSRRRHFEGVLAVLRRVYRDFGIDRRDD